MAETLEPCPFCGGEANLMSDYSSEHDHTFWQVWHDCSTNPGPIRHTYGHALGMEISTPWCASEDAAIALWNRRAKRTCRKVPGRMKYGRRIPKCSECGYSLGDSRYVYCPNCGARVMEDDE